MNDIKRLAGYIGSYKKRYDAWCFDGNDRDSV